VALPVLYARAVLPSLPLLRDLPGLRKAPGGRPADLEQHRSAARVDRDHLAAYQHLTGWRLGDTLPGLYPHLIAFEAQLRVLVDRRFPFAPLGLVHVANTVTAHRPVTADEALDVVCRPARLRPHRRGRLVDIETTVRVGDETVWEETTTLLARGGGNRATIDEAPLADAEVPAADTGWELPGNLGRRYAAVSRDLNPIHLSRLTARAFGFRRAVVHGMWTASRALGLVEHRLPSAYRYDVAFRRPLLLPGHVRAGTHVSHDETVTIGVVSADATQTHLVGRVTPR
jgi:acyl dehydratase